MTDSRAHRVHAEVLAAHNPLRLAHRVHAEVLWGTVARASTGPTLKWWDGTTEQAATVAGWWDGTTVQAATIEGWWDGTAVQPLA